MDPSEALTVLRVLVDSSGHPEADVALDSLTVRVRDLERRCQQVEGGLMRYRKAPEVARFIRTGNAEEGP